MAPGVRTLLALAILALSVLLPIEVGADDVAVPIGLQAELIAKVAGYDKSFVARAGERAHVFVLRKQGDADSTHVAAQMMSALSGISKIGGLPHDDSEVVWSGAASLANAVKKQRIAIVYLTPGFHDDVGAIRAALDGVDVMTVAALPDDVPRGIVLGFDLVSGKTKLLCNLAQAKRQNVAFKAEALKLMKVYE
jgi:YfiR/HmsC-like